MIKLSWASLEYSNIDGMTRFKKKLQDLKVIIRRWVKTKRLEMVGSKLDTIVELEKIDKAMDIGVVDDCTVLRRIQLPRSISISHLFYADDAMFIGEWSDNNLKGVMVGDNMSRLRAWDDIILKIKSRLSKWKVKNLSIGGRLTLLKSVL
nr:RNA-directed DNA polymerase, eukaryota, reverse transcriptase zinc-binding domain protein [Tanacetum cinerariifolium]